VEIHRNRELASADGAKDPSKQEPITYVKSNEEVKREIKEKNITIGVIIGIFWLLLLSWFCLLLALYFRSSGPLTPSPSDGSEKKGKV